MKIALGTVQLGLDYGISNKKGQVSAVEANNILSAAINSDITTIDTAPAYGDSERVLGKLNTSQHFSFVTKVSPNQEKQYIIKSCKESLKNLKVNKLSGLMLHHGESLLGDDGATIYQQLYQAKAQGLTEKIGCSVYSAQQAIDISNKYNIDIVQLPGNIFDQEILDISIGKQLKAKNIEIHVRSLFLQGVIFLKANALPKHLIELQPHLTKLNLLASYNQKSIISFALSPFVQCQHIDKIVIGCCSAQELDDIIQSYNAAKNLTWDHKSFAVNNERIIKPSLWP